MQSLAILCQLVIALGIFNVWIIRYGKETNWRGGEAKNMKEEFAAYGLPGGFMIFIGAAKILLATCLIIGIWIPLLVKPAAIAMAFLMIGAVSMHVFAGEVRKRLDEAGYEEIPVICSLPAAIEMAKVMVNMRLVQSPRAYPSALLKAKPKFR